MKEITLITPTGNRPEAFALCESMISDALKGITYDWIVIYDDPKNPPHTTMGQSLGVSKLAWTPGINTQRYCLDAALEFDMGDYIFIIEDDDYYSPEYFKELLKYLDYNMAVGLSNSRYYNLKIPGYKEMANYMHSSLCNTGFRKDLLPIFREAVHSGDFYIDIKFWNLIEKRRMPAALIMHSDLSIGIKGLPGREGLGAGHKRKDYYEDPNLDILKAWLGDAHTQYLPYIKRGELNANSEGETGFVWEGNRRVFKPGRFPIGV